MKPLYILSFAVALLFSIQGAFAQKTAVATQKAPAVKKAPLTIKFAETEHNFGNVPQGTPVTTDFVFKNTGKKPVLIESVKASCGCTTPSYTKEPVKRKKNGTIKVQYNASSAGSFNKTVTVNTNVGTVLLRIKGTVDKKPDTK